MYVLPLCSCLSFFLLLLLQTQVVLGERTCINNYGELKNAILNNTENKEDLLRGFYPPNQSPSHIITVYYYFQSGGDNGTYPDEFNSTDSNYTFQWVDSSTLLLLEWRLFNALSFDIAQLTENNISLIVSPGFCEKDEEVKLLNMATIWLKSYAVGELETERYYSLYFEKDEEKFIVLGNDVRGTAYALMICEFLAAFGAMVVLYALLLLSRFKTFHSVANMFSKVSTSCFGLMLVMIIKDIVSYREAYTENTFTWYYTFPLPIVLPIWSIINLVLSVLVVFFIGDVFPLPGLLRLFYNHCCKCNKNKYIKSCLQVVLVFSIACVVLLVAFHFVWILLAFSAYPVRSIASQAFTMPLLVGLLTIFFLIDAISNAPSLLREATTQLRRIGVGVILSALLSIPIIIGLFGTLYFYSQALVKINETENNPIKTIIAGLAPTIVAALLAWFTRKTIIYFDSYKTTEESTRSSDTKRRSNIWEVISDSNKKAKDKVDENENESDTVDEEMIPLI